jgi:hypothetical protein
MKKDYYFVGQVLAQPKEVKIEIPEGYEIDKEKSTFEKIVFKKKDNKPRSWGEYCNNFKGELFYFGNRNSFESVIANDGMSYMAKDYLPSKELAKAFLAMMQIMSLRQAWIGDWKPDWSDTAPCKYCICGLYNDEQVTRSYFQFRYPLSFPTRKMAEDFMNTFRDLIKIAKPLI